MTDIAHSIEPEKANNRTNAVSVDQVLALLFAPFAITLLAVLYVIVVTAQGRPFLYSSERMRTPRQSFRLLKIRTMHPVLPGDGETVLGGHQSHRVTPVGAILRRSRLDELPQIFNVLKGDIRFIGPRPPLRRYVESYPELYAKVLGETPPGITGLATVTVHRREERLLSACTNAREADRVYQRRCIPVKARLDLIYRDRRSASLNALILFRTFARLPHFARARQSAARHPISRVVPVVPAPV